MHEPFCERCGVPTEGADLCEKCKTNPPAYREMRSWAVFDSPVQNGLYSLKYRRNMGLGEALAIQMADFCRRLEWPIQALIPVPLSQNRLKERGYNQVGLVARPLAYHVGLAYEPGTLRKVRETSTQVGLTVSQRQANVHHAYQADPQIVTRKSILLMDDVATMGSTTSACNEALLSAGAQEVYILTIARALSHHSLDRV